LKAFEVFGSRVLSHLQNHLHRLSAKSASRGSAPLCPAGALAVARENGTIKESVMGRHNTSVKGSAQGTNAQIGGDHSATNLDPASEAAAIEYAGVSGASKECQDAVLRLIQWGDRITRVRILSCGRDHSLLLTINAGDLVAVKSGFRSGYGGEGPHRFSYVLQVLDCHGTEIEEFDASQDLLARIDESAMTRADLARLDAARPHCPHRWHDYVFEDHHDKARNGTLWHCEFPPVVPFALIDSRIMDLALSFWDGPDDKLMLGYRRLEDLVRERTGIAQHGTKLFSKAFSVSDGLLTWTDANDGERTGRMNLFAGTYAAHRNPRAHTELGGNAEELLAEFLLLNHLYRLERDAVVSTPSMGDVRLCVDQRTSAPD
jgi:hypothetical protein